LELVDMLTDEHLGELFWMEMSLWF
jgi:hypothetical protein